MDELWSKPAHLSRPNSVAATASTSRSDSGASSGRHTSGSSASVSETPPGVIQLLGSLDVAASPSGTAAAKRSISRATPDEELTGGVYADGVSQAQGGSLVGMGLGLSESTSPVKGTASQGWAGGQAGTARSYDGAHLAGVDYTRSQPQLPVRLASNLSAKGGNAGLAATKNVPAVKNGGGDKSEQPKQVICSCCLPLRTLHSHCVVSSVVTIFSRCLSC